MMRRRPRFPDRRTRHDIHRCNDNRPGRRSSAPGCASRGAGSSLERAIGFFGLANGRARDCADPGDPGQHWQPRHLQPRQLERQQSELRHSELRQDRDGKQQRDRSLRDEWNWGQSRVLWQWYVDHARKLGKQQSCDAIAELALDDAPELPQLAVVQLPWTGKRRQSVAVSARPRRLSRRRAPAAGSLRWARCRFHPRPPCRSPFEGQSAIVP
jgi:hypothetical protein